ncbi:MAG: GNAT family N-acetyltransferase [Candidatus Hydrogenedentes bacterium]|nr:GNAT family N-acetyltransferase [Candidatus Hydrogenedentota bacterium]
MEIRYLEQDHFLRDFFPLIVELECGSHYDTANPQHREWISRRVGALYAMSGNAISLYSDEGTPMGFFFLLHDRGLAGVRCFGKKGTIAMFGLFPEFRSQGIGASLLREAETFLLRHGGECLYVDTYANNAGAIRYYTKEGFIPVAYHPGENGLDDKGQVYLYKALI